MEPAHVLAPPLEHAHCACRQGYIYVESYKEAHVREAIQGLRNIFGGKGAKLVPLAEMVDAVNVPRPSKALLGAVENFDQLWSRPSGHFRHRRNLEMSYCHGAKGTCGG